MVGVILTFLGVLIVTELVTAATFFIVDQSLVNRGLPTTDEQVETITTFAQEKLEGNTDSASLLLAGTVALITIPIILAATRSRVRAIKQIKETGQRQDVQGLLKKVLIATEKRKFSIAKKGIGVGIPAQKLVPQLDITGDLIHFPGLGLQTVEGDKVFVATHPKIQQAIDLFPNLIVAIPSRNIFLQSRRRRIFLPPGLEDEDV